MLRARSSTLRRMPRGHTGIAGVPAGELHVVVQLVLAIPAEHDVAETVAALQRRQELRARHVFAAHDAVDVEHADLDVREVALLDDRLGVGDRLDLPGLDHAITPWSCRN